MSEPRKNAHTPITRWINSQYFIIVYLLVCTENDEIKIERANEGQEGRWNILCCYFDFNIIFTVRSCVCASLLCGRFVVCCHSRGGPYCRSIWKLSVDCAEFWVKAMCLKEFNGLPKSINQRQYLHVYSLHLGLIWRTEHGHNATICNWDWLNSTVSAQCDGCRRLPTVA